MAQGFSAEAVGVLDGTLNPAAKFDGILNNAKLRAFQATFDLAAATTKGTSGDTDVLFRFPAGHHPVAFVINASVSLGTSTISIGTAAVPAKYKAAATFTSTDTPTLVMKSSAADDPPLTAFEDVIMTIGTANLPGAGILQIWGITSSR